MEQTAVKWLKKELEEYGSPAELNIDWSTFDELCKQAKAMEKKQIIEARVTAPILSSPDKSDYKEEAEQYYTETYGKD